MRPPATDARRAALIRLMLFGALVLTLFAVATIGGYLPTADEVRDRGDELGAAGQVLFIPAGALLLCLFAPSQAVAGSAGLLFGTAEGTPLALAAVVLGAVTQMSITRYIAGDAAEQLLPERVKQYDRMIERRGFWAVFYMRLAPAIPYTLVNYGAGLTKLRILSMAGGTAIGAAPRTFAWVALGGSLTDLRSTEAKVAVGLLVCMAVLGAVLARRQLASERSV